MRRAFVQEKLAGAEDFEGDVDEIGLDVFAVWTFPYIEHGQQDVMVKISVQTHRAYGHMISKILHFFHASEDNAACWASWISILVSVYVPALWPHCERFVRIHRHVE